ncbi:hypothetical protein DPMN_014350 [Dreissena polymorpha]|uniref:Uncharacterized protein n=1 Tax=Dreissena polymorpha TaxID=45954 RepID=A0A9D4NAL6_DREPO|nr:hypothetical protein DPMN_014350 [Dreissena polymorpha]
MWLCELRCDSEVICDGVWWEEVFWLAPSYTVTYLNVNKESNLALTIFEMKCGRNRLETFAGSMRWKGSQGPKQLPCGTLHFNSRGLEMHPLTLTQQLRGRKYESIHERKLISSLAVYDNPAEPPG